MDKGRDMKDGKSAGASKGTRHTHEYKSEAEVNRPVVTPEETEDALRAVRGRLGLDSSTTDQSPHNHQDSDKESYRSEMKPSKTDRSGFSPKATVWVRGAIAIAASIVIALLVDPIIFVNNHFHSL